MISLPRNQFVAILVGVCILSAAIDSGLERLEDLESEVGGLGGVTAEPCEEIDAFC